MSKFSQYNIKVCFLLLFAIGSNPLFSATPTWEVESSNFQYTMTVTAFVNVDGVTFSSTGDKVAAFVNGSCRGVTNLIYVESINRYLAYLTIYSNRPNEEITFKVYQSSTDLVSNIENNSVEFQIDHTIGLPSSAYSLASPALSKENEVNSITFSNVNIEEITGEDDIEIKVPFYYDNLSSLTPTFSLSDGANLVYEGVFKSLSGNSYDFSNTKYFTILSEDQSASKEVSITVNNYKIDTASFSNKMSFVSEFYVQGIRKNSNDQIAAFVNGECRGKGKLSYDTESSKYLAEFDVYSNDENEAIEFKIYTKSNNIVHDLPDVISFEANRVFGNSTSPFLFSNEVSSSDADIQRITLQDKNIKSIHYDTDTIEIQVDFYDNELENIIPQFQLSDGATLLYNQQAVSNATTAYDFTTLQRFSVQSADLSVINHYVIKCIPEYVEESQFEHKMTIQSFTNINGAFLSSTNDIIAAFVGGQIRGKGQLIYSVSQDRYLATFDIYTNDLGADITFQVYNSTTDLVHDINKVLDFEKDAFIGDSLYSYSISWPALSTLAVMEEITFNEFIISEMSHISDTILITTNQSELDLTSITPIFVVSENAKIHVHNTSLSTDNEIYDFTNGIDVSIVSEDESVVIDKHIRINKNIVSSVQSLSKTIEEDFNLYPNPATGFIRFEFLKKQNISSIKIISLTGESINVDNYKENQVNLQKITTEGIYILEIISEGNLYRKRFIKQ